MVLFAIWIIVLDAHTSVNFSTPVQILYKNLRLNIKPTPSRPQAILTSLKVKPECKLEQKMAYVVPAPTLPTLPVRGTSDVFPVHRIYCVGRNYAAHAVEMGHDPTREDPFF